MPTAEAAARKTKTVTTTITEGSANDAEILPFYKRDFWEIVNTLTADEWNDHMVRVYRADEKWENDGSPKENKFTDRFDEDSIRAKWGGGRYNLWLYGPPSGTKVVRRPFRLFLEGAPKYSGETNGHGANGDSSTLQLLVSQLVEELRASRGGSSTQKALEGALELQVTGFRSAMQNIRDVNAPAATPPEKSSLEKAMDKMLEAMIMKMMNPAPDPFQAKLQEAMLNKLLDPADPIEKFRSIAAAMKDLGGGLLSGGKTDFMSVANGFVAQLPSIIDKAANGVREYRLANESAERVFALQKDHNLNAPGVIDVGANAPAETAAAPPVEAAAPAAPAGGVTEVNGPSIEWVQLMIVDKIENAPELDGVDLYNFLEAVAHSLNEQLGAQTPETLMNIFKSQAILSRVVAHPRLPKIIAEYLAHVKDLAKAKPA